MKNVLILGAGQSAPSLIDYMLKEAPKYDWFVTVCDRNFEMAKKAIGGNPNGTAVEFDVNDERMRHTQIENADLVINFLSPMFQYLIALDCLRFKKHCISASYANPRVVDLNKDAVRNNILILNEMGLDPGIDHMSAMAMIQQVRDNGGYISSFISYGSGIPAPEVDSNPMKYCITWNARNVAMAGESGAQYMEESKIKLINHSQLFNRTWPVEVDGVGMLEAYPNRDSMIYQDVFSLHKVHTMIRGTLRYPGWSETWGQLVKLGIPNEIMPIPNLSDRTYSEFLEMFLPLNANGSKLETRVANFLKISPTGKIMDNLRWLGLFSEEKIGGNPVFATDVLTDILIKKMPLPEGARDMVILVHEMIANYKDRKEKITSTMVEYGEPNGFTAIAKTVGIPAAISAKLLLNGELPLTGCHIPTHPVIYSKVLKELESLNIKFTEKVEVLKD